MKGIDERGETEFFGAQPPGNEIDYSRVAFAERQLVSVDISGQHLKRLQLLGEEMSAILLAYKRRLKRLQSLEKEIKALCSSTSSIDSLPKSKKHQQDS